MSYRAYCGTLSPSDCPLTAWSAGSWDELQVVDWQHALNRVRSRRLRQRADAGLVTRSWHAAAANESPIRLTTRQESKVPTHSEYC